MNRFLTPFKKPDVNRATPGLFMLSELCPLRSEPLTPDMADSLSDQAVLSSAPGVLSIVCEWMETYHTHEFFVCASATQKYGLDLLSSLLTLLERLPCVAEWAGSTTPDDYTVDFNTQGLDLRVILSRSGSGIGAAIIEDHWRNAKRADVAVTETPQSLLHNCRDVARIIAAAAAVIDGRISTLPIFVDWCAKCGYDLGMNR